MNFTTLPKLKKGDTVGIVSPSFAAPGQWPHVYELGLQRLRDVFGLRYIDFPATKKLGASKEERAKDLISTFENTEVKAVIASLGGDDQVTYIRNLPADPFTAHPKPFFGYSDNCHFANHLWLHGIPSYYGGSLFTEFAMNVRMDDFTVEYLQYAFFQGGMVELKSSPVFNDIGLDWSNPAMLNQKRRYQENEGWYWDGNQKVEGITWGGCLESIDEMLRHNVAIPSLDEFASIILFVETSEELPSHDSVFRIFRALGERGILERIQCLLVGRPKAWEFERQNSDEEKVVYKAGQRDAILRGVRQYNIKIPVVQNMDFGHTAPQICLPVGRRAVIDPGKKSVAVEF